METNILVLNKLSYFNIAHNFDPFTISKKHFVFKPFTLLYADVILSLNIHNCQLANTILNKKMYT
jgi:hypothetical protein